MSCWHTTLTPLLLILHFYHSKPAVELMRERIGALPIIRSREPQPGKLPRCYLRPLLSCFIFYTGKPLLTFLVSANKLDTGFYTPLLNLMSAVNRHQSAPISSILIITKPSISRLVSTNSHYQSRYTLPVQRG